MTDPRHRPVKPPKPPGISSSNASVVPIGFALSLDQSSKVIEQTAVLNQNIPILGIQLKMAKSSVSVYFGNLVGSVTVAPTSITLSIGADQVISAVAKDSLGVPISGRPITAVSTNTQVCTVVSTSGNSAALSITLHPLSAGNCQINVTCDGMVGICSVTVSAIIIVGQDLFVDNYVGGVKAGAQNGIFYSATVSHPEFNPPSILSVQPDPGNASGYCLDAAFGTNPNIINAGSGLLEQHMKLPNMTEIFFEQTVGVDADYFHRNVRTDNNNKGLRIWDTSYADSKIHVGYSTRTNSAFQNATTPIGTGDGSSNVFMEWHTWGKTGASNWNNKGPFTHIYLPGTTTKLGFYCKLASAENVPDGIIMFWINDILKFSDNTLNLCTAGGGVNGANLMKEVYFPGAPNSGFGRDALNPVNPTHVRIRKLLIRNTHPY